MKKALLPFLCVINLLCLSGPALALTASFSGAPYCSVPAVPGAGIKANVLLLLDNSLSMTDLAYDRGKHCTPTTAKPCTIDTDCASGQICRDKVCSYLAPTPCSSGSDCAAGLSCAPDGRPFYCVDDSYRDGNSYSGYFDQKTIYRYDSGSSRFVVDSLSPNDPCSGSCPASTSYLRVDLAGSAPNRTVQTFKASGNFLNWLSASKLDQAKQVLTGGKLDGDGMLVAESRGCLGKRFVKLVPDAPLVTFTVRGGNAVPAPYEFEWQPGPPGPTAIEIYDRSYPRSSCLSAVNDWESAVTSKWDSPTVLDHLENCMGQSYMTETDPTTNGPMLSAAQMYLKVRSYCYGGMPPPDDYFIGDCRIRYHINDMDHIKPYAGDEICSELAVHPPILHGRFPDTKGYVGLAAQGGSTSTLAQNEAKDYCSSVVSYPPASDPTFSPVRSGSIGNMPAIVFDSGIYGLGKPAGTCQARLAPPSPLTGAIQEFGSDLNFGVMTFNDEGLYGGKVVLAVGSPIGTHQDKDSGLVYAVDHVATHSSSPLAESFYNAIGYFANRSDLKLQSGDFSPPSPAQYSCQKNSVVIVSDGISSLDQRSEVKGLVTKWAQTTGSYDVDDLASLARNKSLSDFSKSPANSKDYLSTYVIYTGTPCGVYNDDGSCVATDEGVPEKLMQLTASNGAGRMVSAANTAGVQATLAGILNITAGSASETAIVSTGDGNGALFLQDRFWPSKSFDAMTSANWIGELQSLWYYIDPFLDDPSGAGSRVREDTNHDGMLTLKEDSIVQLDGDGLGGGGKTLGGFDDLQSLWRAGKALWERDPTSRQLMTSVDGRTLIKLCSDTSDTCRENLKLLAPFLNVTESEAAKLIAWVLGTDQDGYRSRKVRITDPVTNVAATREWKLGDISSTPQVQSSVPLGSYHLPPPRGYNDTSYASFARSSDYQGRGMVYAGANDGILHAFNLGKLQTGSFDLTTPAEVKAKLTGSDLGREAWGFIPKNVLPYLKYLAEPSYRHLFLLDGKISLVDAAIGYGNAWRTVLIGGMGLGGASADPSNCAAGNDCVPTPVSNTGYSSYFALDVTDPANPALLWEFSDSTLGYSTSGPAIVKTGRKWFAVFGSGPNSSIDNNHQFQGRSNHNLKFFVVELRAGATLDGGVSNFDTGIENAFAGSMIGGGIDTDKANPSHQIDIDKCGPSDQRCLYSDDAVYVGYTKDGSDGGVLRISTNDSSNPAQWKWSYVVQGIGPVTSGIAKIQDRKNHQLWLYFGTGRHFFNGDDAAGRRALYGVKDPCYNFTNVEGAIARPDGLDPSCSTPADVGKAGNLLSSSKDGWRIDLASAGAGSDAERVVSTPTATAGGAVFFPTFQPGSAPCSPGSSYLWEVRYDTGAAPDTPLLQGKVLMPLSSGDTHESSLAAAGGRGPAVTGKAGSVKVISNSGLRPVKKIVHIQER